MKIRLYKALPEEQGPAVQPPASDESGNPVVVVTCLERNSDPDGNNHTGYDYWGAYAENGEPLDAWESGPNSNVLVRIEYTELPNPVTYYPAPFSSENVTTFIRTRDESGRFVADDPATPDVDEAWTEVTL
jgi:hypothetical protein